MVRDLAKDGRRTQRSESQGGEEHSLGPLYKHRFNMGVGAASADLRRRRRGGFGRVWRKEGHWARACGSARAGPGQLLLPSLSTSAPPLSLFLSLYNASTTLAARSLMSGTSAGADWADARVRESGSRVWLSSYSGNRASNPRGRGAERSSAQRLGPSSLRRTVQSILVAIGCLPPYSQALPVRRTRRPTLDHP